MKSVRLPQQQTDKLVGVQHFPETKYRTKRGVLVCSKSVCLIDNWLHDHGIVAEYEKSMPLGHYLIHPDFWLPQFKICIEHLGLLNDSDYQKSWEWKQKLYQEYGTKYITTTEDDIPSLDESLTRKLLPLGLGGRSR